MNQEVLDFSNVDSAEGGNGTYLKPGRYYVKPTAVELSEKAGSTSAIKVTFTAVNEEYAGQSVDEKFFLSQKALPRLQYLHESYLGFKLENKAISYQKLADYLSQKLLVKPKTIFISVGGQEGNNGKVYGSLPYADFIIDNDADAVEGAFEEGSPEYIKSIRKSRNASTASSSAVLSNSNSAKSDLPWDN